MNELIKLNAMLRLYESNFLNLHWNAKEEDFNDSHKGISTDYYELAGKYVDVTAEMVCRLGRCPLNYQEVGILSEKSGYTVVESQKLYSREDIIELSDKMLGDIVTAIGNCLESEEMKATINAGIKSTLESMLDEFDIQYRYINKRRMM